MEFKLETERLWLREMCENDYYDLARILGDRENMKHYPVYFDEKRIRGWIERNMQRYKTFGFGLWAVCLKGSGEMIGDCGLTLQMIDGEIRPEIGYHIRRDRQRKGYAKEAAMAVRDWTFRTLPFGEIYSYMKASNEPSARTAVSWGCRYILSYADEADEPVKVFRMTRAEWIKEEKDAI